MKKYLTAKEVADQLGVRIDLALAWLNSGAMRGINIAAKLGPGKRPYWRVLQEDVDAFVESRRVGPKPSQQRPRRKRPDGVIEFFPAKTTGKHQRRKLAKAS